MSVSFYAAFTVELFWKFLTQPADYGTYFLLLFQAEFFDELVK